MKRTVNIILALTLILTSLAPLTSCKEKEEIEILHVYNCEEYISDYDEEWETIDVLSAFEEYASEIRSEEEGKNIKVQVEYSTFGTLENMYNELQLTKHRNGKTGEYEYNYDLVCPSDYMIQRMLNEGMLEKFDVDEDGNHTYLPYYDENVSPFISDMFLSHGWNEYSVCYMWGTMGFVYNPEKLIETNDTLSILPEENAEEQLDAMVHSWALPWDEYYKNLGTIKDSIRDTYALAVGYVYREGLTELRQLWENGDLTDRQYQETLIKIFNNVDSDLMEDIGNLPEYDGEEETLAKVRTALSKTLDGLNGQSTVNACGKELKTLKYNVYGFEVDSGKKDMASGKIAINFAWSGDAAYTLDCADEAEGATLYYAVPNEGSNVWFDGWVMPKGANKHLAQMFVDFLSMPENAISNMDYIGYVSPIAGDDVFEAMLENYELTFEPDEDHTVEIDYSYYFKDTLDLEYFENEYGVDLSNGIIVYSSEDNIGRQLTTQYPFEETVKRCAIMCAFNHHELQMVNNMWSDVKVGNVPTWILIGIPVFIVILILCIVTHVILKKRGIRIEFKKKSYGKLISSK